MDKHQMRDPFADWQIKENKVPEGVSAEGTANRVPEEARAEKRLAGKSLIRKNPGKSLRRIGQMKCIRRPGLPILLLF